MRRWIAVLTFALALARPGSAEDNHAGYYYPEPTSREEYVSRARQMVDADRGQRLAFLSAITLGQLERPFPPPFALFAKGDDAEKLIIISMNAGYADTLYRMRGFLALLTQISRQSPVFVAFKVDEVFTFLDLLRMLGFEQVTISDGDRYAHQILIR
jgi:hypothetical protein